MKKLLIVLGVIFICLIVIGLVLLSMAAHTGIKLDKESKVYVDRIVPQIVTSWDVKKFLNDASPELLEVAPAGKIESLFKALAEKLGAYKSYKGSKGSSLISITPLGKVITATYAARVAFEKADGTIKIRVIKHGQNWQILEFYVD